MHFIFLGILIVGLVFGPQWWARHVFKRYNKQLEHLPGTGGELARHLIARFELQNVKLETTEKGDHYDPKDKTVRLSAENMNGKSLTAIAIAAHEVGHAIQHAKNNPLLTLRTRLVLLAQTSERIGSVLLFTIPIIAAITRAPSAGLLMFVAAFSTIAISTIVHLVTLPVEWDASFGKALPILKAGDYIHADEEKAVKTILKAAAFTYLAGSLASLLNFWRWLAVLKRR